MSKNEVLRSEQLAENILYFPGHANTVALKLEQKAIIVDVGRNIHEGKKVRDTIETSFETKVDTVILTHFHSDHTHSLPLYSDCEIIASQLVIKFLKAAKRKNLKVPKASFEQEHIIKDGSYKVVVKQTGGHTPDSCYVFSPNHKLVIVGDNLRSDFLWGGRQSDPEKWISALQEYISFDVDYIIPGHGGIMTTEEVSAIAEYTVEVRDFLHKLLQEGTKEHEVVARVNSEKPPSQTQVYIHESTLIKWYKFWKSGLFLQ
ncbi:MAG: MBL fold metallo-hydrolase [Candidatus Hodarchaeales archaeon]|jgi:glyoxylase-like metal-dependent hydrolase (beta-lactamase superfamily II)